MKGILTVIKWNGALEKTGMLEPIKLEAIQKAVGGSIETVPGFETYLGQPCVAFCNEEGKINGLALNTQATRFWYAALDEEFPGKLNDVLVGDVAILTGDAEFMEEL